MKKLLSHLLTTVFILLIIVGFLCKDKLNNYVSDALKETLPQETSFVVARDIQAQYNYTKNGKPFTHTFLEFGSTGCISCKKMETTMDEVKHGFKNVQVVFYNVSDKAHQDLLKQFGISVIPTQVILDKDAKEIFRHNGFISSYDLSKQF